MIKIVSILIFQDHVCQLFHTIFQTHDSTEFQNMFDEFKRNLGSIIAKNENKRLTDHLK